MRNRIFAVGLVILLAGVLASAGMAQTRMQQRGAGQLAAQAVDVNSNIVTLVGTVTGVNMAPGQGMPSITLQSNTGEVTVLVGPYRLLADKKFEIKQGQILEVKAFQDPRMPNAFVATELKDSSTGATVNLRSAAGMPQSGRGAMGMMRGGGRMRGMGGAGAGMMNGMGACADGANLDLKAKTMLEGTVQTVDMAAGQGFPSFTLQAGSNTFTVVAGPFWALQQADFKISQGDRLSVEAYPSLQHQNTWVAAAIQNITTQESIRLRDQNGRPLAMRGRGPMNGIRR
jgi:DNA/RNA endonuclease YhcR with UshA esterase domain